jgi:hypothetical protein
MFRLKHGFHGTCGCYENDYLALHVLVDLAGSGRWDASLRRSDYSERRWKHIHTSGETMPPCTFDMFIESEDMGRFHVNQKFIDAVCRPPQNIVEQIDTPAKDYDKMPVTALIDELLTLIHDCILNMGIRAELKNIRDGIFLELPETRCELLCKVGSIINRHVPDRTQKHVYFDPFWNEIKDIMNKSFERYRGKHR